jgi:hypothetical protein
MFLFCSYPRSYLFLYVSFFCPILSYFILFFRYIFQIFPDFPRFSRIFPSFSYAVMCFFPNIADTYCAKKMYVLHVKKIIENSGFFFVKIFFLKWNLDIYKCPFLILKKKFIKVIYFVSFLKNGQNVPILFLSMFLFVLIRVLFLSFFVLFFLIFSVHFLDFPRFSRIFPDFSKFFLCSHVFFSEYS